MEGKQLIKEGSRRSPRGDGERRREGIKGVVVWVGGVGSIYREHYF